MQRRFSHHARSNLFEELGISEYFRTEERSTLDLSMDVLFAEVGLHTSQALAPTNMSGFSPCSVSIHETDRPLLNPAAQDIFCSEVNKGQMRDAVSEMSRGLKPKPQTTPIFMPHAELIDVLCNINPLWYNLSTVEMQSLLKSASPAFHISYKQAAELKTAGQNAAKRKGKARTKQSKQGADCEEKGQS